MVQTTAGGCSISRIFKAHFLWLVYVLIHFAFTGWLHREVSLLDQIKSAAASYHPSVSRPQGQTKMTTLLD